MDRPRVEPKEQEGVLYGTCGSSCRSAPDQPIVELNNEEVFKIGPNFLLLFLKQCFYPPMLRDSVTVTVSPICRTFFICFFFLFTFLTSQELDPMECVTLFLD